MSASKPWMKRFGLALIAFLGACASPGSEIPARTQPAPIPADAPFRDEVLRFAQLDRQTPPPKCPVLFVGSSSIRLWSTLPGDMAPLPVLNRGFGGSTISDVNRYFDRLVTPYGPRAIVFYAGENDIDSGQSPVAVAAQFRRFLDTKRERLGGVPVFYITAKPSKSRIAQLELQSQLNQHIRTLARASPDLIIVDVAAAMISEGRPRDLFLADGLHMTAAGYAIWADLVRRALVRLNVGRSLCRPSP